MNLSKLTVAAAFILTAQTGLASEISFKSQCSKAYENIQSIEGILNQFKPGAKIVGLNKDYLENQTGMDVSSTHKMTNGLRIKLIKKVSFLQNQMSYCGKDLKASIEKSKTDI